MTTETQKALQRMTPSQWYKETRLSFWDVFDVDGFVPNLDGFTNLAVTEMEWAASNGVKLHGPELAQFLLHWWRSVEAVA